MSPQMMNKTLAIQLSQITGYNEEETKARKVYWIQMYNARQKYLTEVNKSIEADGMVAGSKERSKAYSDAVVAYDRRIWEVKV